MHRIPVCANQKETDRQTDLWPPSPAQVAIPIQSVMSCGRAVNLQICVAAQRMRQIHEEYLPSIEGGW